MAMDTYQSVFWNRVFTSDGIPKRQLIMDIIYSCFYGIFFLQYTGNAYTMVSVICNKQTVSFGLQ
jgi:hypothetical protein